MYKRNIISFYVVYINAVKSRKLFTTFKLRFKVSIILTKNEKKTNASFVMRNGG